MREGGRFPPPREQCMLRRIQSRRILCPDFRLEGTKIPFAEGSPFFGCCSNQQGPLDYSNPQNHSFHFPFSPHFLVQFPGVRKNAKSLFAAVPAKSLSDPKPAKRGSTCAPSHWWEESAQIGSEWLSISQKECPDNDVKGRTPNQERMGQKDCRMVLLLFCRHGTALFGICAAPLPPVFRFVPIFTLPHQFTPNFRQIPFASLAHLYGKLATAANSVRPNSNPIRRTMAKLASNWQLPNLVHFVRKSFSPKGKMAREYLDLPVF